jgi:hypothetical protein
MDITMRMHGETILDDKNIDIPLLNDEQVKFLGYVQNAWKAIFGKDPKVEISDNPIGDDDMPNWGLVVEGSFEIYPANVRLTDEEMFLRTVDVKPYKEFKKDNRPHEVVRLVLTVSVPEYNYPHAPDSSDEIEVVYSVGITDIIDKMILMMVKHDLDNMWEATMMAESIEEDKKYEGWLHG